MASPYAFVTLVSSDSYLPGALALVAAIHDLHPLPRFIPFQSVCLVTPESVDVSSIKLLRKAFDLVVGVEILEQEDNSRLSLLGRPDLTTVLTKLHVFRLTQYSKIIFFDADVLPLRPVSHLFELPHEFAAAPDVGWPDIFNSGVLVLTPGEDKFAELDELMKSKGSWDGGDQGILNEWRGDNWHRLSFTYNTTPTAAYTYAPAYERFGSQISVIHFIGPNKPWKSIPYRSPFTTRGSQKSDSVNQAYDYDTLVDRWFAVYDNHYRSQPVIPSISFEVKHYSSAWDEGGSRTTRKFPSAIDALSLDDLKRLAIEGMNATGVGSESHPGEGEYRSMPLEGRVDLMRPRKEKPKDESEEESVPEAEVDDLQGQQAGEARYDDFDYDNMATPVSRSATLPANDSPQWHASGPHQIPPSPRPAVISLPPTPTPNIQFYQESSAGDTDDGDGGYFFGAPHHQSAHDQGRPDHERRRVSPQHSFRGSPPHKHGHNANATGQHARDSPPHHNRDRHHHHHHHHGHTQHAVQQSSDVGQQAHGSQHQQEHYISQQHGHRPRHEHQEQQRSSPDSQQESGQWHNSGGDGARTPQQEQRRPPSPPLLLWDPAKDPPPKTLPMPSAFPTDTYFPNVWDQASSGKSHNSTIHQEGSKPLDSTAFFEPPPPSEIPDSLLREGHYRNVTGEDGAGSPPVPNPTKVKSVFPWEEKPRQLPGRVFPAADTPKPSQFAAPPLKPTSPVIVSPSTPPKPTSPIRLLSPLGLTTPLRSTYSNAWDSVPSIQKYASKLVRPPPAPAPMFPAFDEEWRQNRRKSWDERVEVSSRDGDDEDNADDEDEDEQQAPTHTNIWDDDDDSEIETARRHSNSRRNSTASSYSYKSKKKEYRSRGVQTVQVEKRHQSIQVSTDPPLRAEQRRGSTASSGRRHWPASSGLNISSPATMQTARVGHDLSVSTAAPSPMSEVPQGHSLRTRGAKLPSPSVLPSTQAPLRSPREFIVSPVAQAPQRSVNEQLPRLSTPPVKSPPSSTRSTASTVRITVPQSKSASPTSNSRPPSLVMRQISNDSSLPSPASSVGPLSPSDGQPISPPVRRVGRVWDPARGVELFKRSSEEVLARFLKMGSWEENGR